MDRYIWIKGRRYYYYGTYDRYDSALRMGKLQRKLAKSRWFILKYEAGFWFPENRYRLYLDKIITL